MDRTKWKKRGKWINILTVALSYKGRAIPLFWIVFGRRGNTSFEHWTQVLVPVIEALKQMDWSSAHIHVVADREFASPKLAEWLKKPCYTRQIDRIAIADKRVYTNAILKSHLRQELQSRNRITLHQIRSSVRSHNIILLNARKVLATESCR